MGTLLAFAGSNSSTSINFRLVRYTVGLIHDRAVDCRDMAEVSIPMYSEDRERAAGFPDAIEDLYQALQKTEGLVLSVNEHNGNPSAFTKNLLDWLSRKDRAFLEGVPILLMSTSPGKRGAQSSHGIIEGMLKRFGGQVTATFSLPSFKEHFGEDGIAEPELREAHAHALSRFLQELN